MSTRSGRRIHGSFHEIEVHAVAEPTAKSVKKTRSKRLKDSNEILETTIIKSKKRKNYVSYTSEDESVGVSEMPKDKEDEPVRVLRKNALKEQNLNISNTESIDVVDSKKPVRTTRRTKRFVEDDPEPEKEVPESSIVGEKMGKKNKKKKSKTEEANENEVAVSKKSKRKKKKQENNTETKNSVNRSNMSVDSFHSAAGSPVQPDEVLNATFEKSPTKEQENDTNISLNVSRMSDKKQRQSFHMNSDIESVPNIQNKASKTNTPNSKRISTQNSTFEVTDVETAATKQNTPNAKRLSRQNSNFETEEIVINRTFEKEKRKSSLKNSTFDANISKTVDTNSTFDKNDSPSRLNTTSEKEGRRKSLRLSSAAPEVPEPMNSTYDKVDKESDALNATFDKETKLNSTFDKDEEKSSSKSSLVTSDDTGNLTFDKSERISITSDDSRIENTTPVLIESSLDESCINTLESKKESPKNSLPTPLKREGTFTKDGPEVDSKTSLDLNGLRTPTKRMSLATPGSTPFPFSKSGQKEKAMLNVTRSIEKSRLSLSVDPAPRMTRVMFCSPVNNPVVVAQQKRKVIKSNLKGSNKSFVFQETASPVRAAPRKRSYTHNDVDAARAKRCRLADEQLQTSQRLSSHRTSTAKPSEPSTPSKRIPTPSKSKSESKVSRTKLPNFAALHQRRFDKMESLDECQERKAKRARQLLTPSAAVNVLDRSSPRVSEQGKQKEVIKRPEAKIEKRQEPKKHEQKVTRSKEVKVTVSEGQKQVETDKSGDKVTKTDATKAITLDTLKRGYTRFGFKMNIGVNPFSVPSKMEPKVKEMKNGLKREVSQPSLAGASGSRKEVAKQLVMREKSFTGDRRDLKRKENRTVIKGVRTNRRFELQMQMRNIS